jgi:ABC-type transport system involved in cytochrome c biogenesis ATPase subunit
MALHRAGGGIVVVATHQPLDLAHAAMLDLAAPCEMAA